jgi:hypothetical protein
MRKAKPVAEGVLLNTLNSICMSRLLHTSSVVDLEVPFLGNKLAADLTSASVFSVSRLLVRFLA